MGMAGHYALGNSNSLATIDVAGAFIVCIFSRWHTLSFFFCFCYSIWERLSNSDRQFDRILRSLGYHYFFLRASQVIRLYFLAF